MSNNMISNLILNNNIGTIRGIPVFITKFALQYYNTTFIVEILTEGDNKIIMWNLIQDGIICLQYEGLNEGYSYISIYNGSGHDTWTYDDEWNLLPDIQQNEPYLHPIGEDESSEEYDDEEEETKGSDQLNSSDDDGDSMVFNIALYTNNYSGAYYCNICSEERDNYNNGASVSCGHNFCKQCIDEWIRVQLIQHKKYPKCPNCRTQLTQ